MAERVYPVVIRAVGLAFRALGIELRMTGLENIPARGGLVLASNHVSYLDFIFAGYAPWTQHGRLTRFMAKDAVFRHPVSGPLMRGMHHIPVDREAGSASLRAALKALRAGEIVGVFPEATVSQSFTVKELKSGAVRMAASARVPILPVVVWGGHQIYGKGIRRSWTRGKTISVAVSPPFTVSTRDDMAAATERLRATLQESLDHVQADHPATADPPPGAWWLPAHLGGTAPTPAQAAELDAAAVARRRAKRAREHARRDEEKKRT